MKRLYAVVHYDDDEAYGEHATVQPVYTEYTNFAELQSNESVLDLIIADSKKRAVEICSQWNEEIDKRHGLKEPFAIYMNEPDA